MELPKQRKKRIKKNKYKRLKNNNNRKHINYTNYQILIVLLVIIIIIIISFIIFKFKLSNYNESNYNESNYNQSNIIIDSKAERINILEDNKYIIWNKGLNYMKECLNGILNKEIPKYPESNTPVISIIIPLYNAEKTIKSTIRSIQNQNNFSNYEIIIVNDNSKDNSLEIVYDLQKEDKRIKLLKNENNMGTLYSRCVGALSAKGEYIFALDDDDMFFVDDLLKIIYKIASQDNYDIVGFNSVFSTRYNTQFSQMKDGGFYVHKHNLILHQPELGLFPISKNNYFMRNDFTIWAKCIKTKIYQKAVNDMGIERYSNYMSWAEDTSIIFVIFNIAKSYKYVRKYGIFHIEAPFCASYTQNNDQKTFGEIFLMDIVYEFSKNTSDKNYASLSSS